MNPVFELRALGQSIWLDFIDHRMLVSGELERMIEQDGLAGLTSNPTIFQKAIASSNDCDDFIRSAGATENAAVIFEHLQIHDITAACDQFLDTYVRTGGADGFVSIEVSPTFAHDTRGSIEQARHFWNEVKRPNLMVKIPGTREGLPAIEQCLFEGLNINITLLFSVERYLEVTDAYMRALARRAQRGEPIDHIASVASFFVSRVDTKVDRMLDAIQDERRARALRGRIAIANAQVAYRECERIVAGEDWRKLVAQGARRQRLLWASTSTKDPAYPPLYYVDALTGPHTVDTVTLETLRTYLEKGRPEVRITDDAGAKPALAELRALGIDLRRVTDELEDEGVRLFAESYDKALRAVDEKRHVLKAG
jgi:transaldolase